RFRRSPDFELMFASNGASAIETLRENNEVGLVVSDINMPVMDGLAMLAELPSLGRPVKVVVVSAYGDIGNIRSAMNRGAFDFVLIDDDHLAVVIGDVSGKGVASALFMSSARTLLRATAMEGKPPGECVSSANRILARESLPTMFLTLFYGVLDLRTGLLQC